MQLLCYIESYNKMEKARRSSWLLCTGRELMLALYNNKIIDWIEMLCANGMYVCWSLVLLMACNLCNHMNVPGCTKHANSHVVDQFLKAHGISIHAVSIKTNRDASMLK